MRLSMWSPLFNPGGMIVRTAPFLRSFSMRNCLKLIKVMCNTLDGSTSRAQNSGKIQCAMCMRRRLFRVCILPLTACLPLWAGEMRVRRSKTSRVEMKVDYLSLCYRGSDNPAFIWFCDFLSKANRLSCDYQSRFGLASTKDSEVRHRALKTMVKCPITLTEMKTWK